MVTKQVIYPGLAKLSSLPLYCLLMNFIIYLLAVSSALLLPLLSDRCKVQRPTPTLIQYGWTYSNVQV